MTDKSVDKSVAWIIITSAISGMLALIFMVLDIFFDSEILRIGFYLTFSTYAIVWGGVCFMNLFLTAFQSGKISKILGAFSYVVLAFIIAFSVCNY